MAVNIKIDEPLHMTSHMYNNTISALYRRGIVGTAAETYAMSLIYTAQLQNISVYSLLDTMVINEPLFQSDSLTTYMNNRQGPLETTPIVSYRKNNINSYKSKDIIL